MSKFLAILILVLFTACMGSNTSRAKWDMNEPRFSMEADTSYKPNSTKIDDIKRTFYKGKFPGYRILKVNYSLVSGHYIISLVDYNRNPKDMVLDEPLEMEYGSHIESNTKGFQSLLNDMDTILAHPNKDLIYVLDKDLNTGSLSSGEDGVKLFLRGSLGESTFLSLSKAEVDSLRSAFMKYQHEIAE